ncbi:MAG: flavodoxin family protein [Desulfovibrionaceae bacterium]|nr:flavodoxin family protein [Desulfovibrionaceae bacterium]
MNIYAINGSPRKSGNTATVLEHALAGARSAHPEGMVNGSLIQLYELNFHSCASCFACKRLNGPSYGRCGLRDSLWPVLDKLARADALIFGSPIYFGGISGLLRSFLERLLFPFGVYDAAYSSIAPKKMPTAFIYTMNVTAEVMAAQGYADLLRPMERFAGNVFLPPRVLYVHDTYQFDDYSKYKADRFSEAAKRKQWDDQFPLDCRRAFDLGAALATGA